MSANLAKLVQELNLPSQSKWIEDHPLKNTETWKYFWETYDYAIKYSKIKEPDVFIKMKDHLQLMQNKFFFCNPEKFESDFDLKKQDN